MLAERTVFVDGQSPDAAPRAVLIVLHSPYATWLLLHCYFIATSLLLGCYTVVSICLLDFAGYEQVVGGNPESKSASLPVCLDLDRRDPVV